MKKRVTRWAILVRRYSVAPGGEPFLAGRYIQPMPGDHDRSDLPEVVTFDTRQAARDRCKKIRRRRAGWRVSATPVRVSVTFEVKP